MNVQVCRDSSDAVALYLPQRLYLKPFAKLNISVQLPLHKVHGKSISNWELMEKLRKMILPDSFSLLKVSRHSSEVIRFDAELEQKDRLDRVLARLEDRIIQLNDFPDPLKVKVSEAKQDFPSRHSWDSFFRDATDMDEMKPGERPDTVHIANLPISWFVHERDRDDDAPPSESIFKKVFEKYGAIRQVDVPAADPFRMQMKSAIRGISIPPQDAALYFEGYIQFSEYVGFVRCMDALRGKKLLHKKDDIAEWCGMRVDFDKTKHMTDASVKRRAIVRERLTTRQRAKEDEEKQEKDKIAKREARERNKETVSRIIFHSLRQKYERVEKEKLEKMREREERRKKKQLAKLMERDDVDLNGRVSEEQNKLLKAQKKLQAIRLIEELFKRIELRPELRTGRADRHQHAGERSARARIVDRYKQQQEANLEAQRQHLKAALDGRIIIRSALEVKKPAHDRRDSSISSLSSNDDIDKSYKRIKTEKLTTPEREMEYNKATGMYGMPGHYPPPYAYTYQAVPPPPPAYPYQPGLYYGMRGGMGPGGMGGMGPGMAAPLQYFPEAARRARGRGRGRGRARLPYYDGPNPNAHYYRYFKKLAEQESCNEHDDRMRSRSRSRRRSYTRSRSRSRRRSYSRSRSRSRSRGRRRSRSPSRSRNRRSRSRSRSRRSRSHSRSRSRKRSRSQEKRHSKSRSKSKTRRTPSVPKDKETTEPRTERARSKSWSLPKNGDGKTWSKSPKDK